MLLFRKIWERTKWNSWLSKTRSWSALPNVLIIGNLGHTASKSLNCLKLEFRLNIWSCAVVITTALQLNTLKMHFWACQNAKMFIFYFLGSVRRGFPVTGPLGDIQCSQEPSDEKTLLFFHPSRSFLHIFGILPDSRT